VTIEKINSRATDTQANSAKRFAPPPYSQATGELVGVGAAMIKHAPLHCANLTYPPSAPA